MSWTQQFVYHVKGGHVFDLHHQWAMCFGDGDIVATRLASMQDGRIHGTFSRYQDTDHMLRHDLVVNDLVTGAQHHVCQESPAGNADGFWDRPFKRLDQGCGKVQHRRLLLLAGIVEKQQSP